VPLVLPGAATGVALAWVGLRIFIAAAPPDFPRLQRLAIDMRVLAFTAVIALVSNLLFTLVPAWKASNAPLAGALHAAKRTGTETPHRQWLRSVLVAGQIAVAVVLLTGAGLMIRSFTAALSSHLGAETSHLLVFDFRFPAREAFKQVGLYGTSGLFAVSPKPAQTVDRVVERLQPLPGIESVAAVNVQPFGGQNMSLPFSIDGRVFDTSATRTPESLPRADYVAITPNYFATLRIPLRQGRDFRSDDDERSRSVAIVNETFVRRYFSGQEVIGQHVTFHFLPQGPIREIVGVVADVATGRLDTVINPAIYVPHEQQTPQFVGPSVYTRSGMFVVVRTSGEPERLLPAITRTVAEIDPTTPIANAKPVERTLDDQVRFMRLYMLLLVGFGSVAVALAAIGVYGVVAYIVAQRTREFGLRIALGGKTADVLVLVGGHAARVIAVGMAGGVVIAVTASRTLRSLLFGVTATDPATYAAVVLLLMVVSVVACLLPARRAAIVDPMMALRHE
jgi:putative ABC transport system permease protein